MPISRLGFLTMLTYRWECVFASVSSLLMVFIAYYLWRAIFQGAESIGSQLSFATTFTYVAVSMAILTTFNTSAESTISRLIISGDIIRNIVRPIGFHYSQVAAAIGTVALRFVFVFIPCVTAVLVLLPAGTIEAGNVYLFAVSLAGAFAILLHIDILTGLIAVRTEAVWGIRLAKEYIVLICSGAMIPIDWLPAPVAQVMLFLPFQGICHTPMKMLTAQGAPPAQTFFLLGLQLFWSMALIAAVHAGLKHMITKVEVNGG